MAGPSSSSSSSTSPSALPSRLLHLSTLLLLSRSSASSHSTTASLPGSTTPGSGFTHARTLPLHVLSHLLQQYLSLVASTASTAANQAGRTQVGVWDLADALGELGFAGRRGVSELREEAERGDEGVEEEAEQLRELAKGLHDHLAPHAPHSPPLAQLTYNPLHPSELDLLDLAASLPADGASTPSASSSLSLSDEDGEELASPPPASAAATGAAKGEGDLLSLKPDPDALDPFNTTFDPSLSLNLLSDTTSAADAAFLDSLGLGPSSASTPLPTEGPGVGDLPVSIFQPLDLAGRPIPGFDLLAPVGAPGVGVGDLGFATLEEAEEEEEDLRPFPVWKDDASIPAYVPSFLPPFPGMERESSASLARRRRREREREAAIQREREAAAASGTIGRAAAALMLGGGAAGDPWEEVIPYSASSLSTMASEFPNTLPTPSSPHREGRGKGREVEGGGGDGEGEGEGEGEGKKRHKKRRRSLSPPPAGAAEVKPLAIGSGGADGKASTPAPPPPQRNATSLHSFSAIQPLIPHPPSLLRPSTLRRTAASHISHHSRHPELLISSDSLFGSLPYAHPMRQATLPPGFLPDYAPPQIHPFNTNLPWTVSAPVPYHPSSNSSLLPAPPPNPRIPAPLSTIARELSFPLQFDPRPTHKDQLHPNIALFARLRRIGPPGPLGSKGEALNYEYVGNTALVGLSGVEWPERRWDAKLPRRGGGEDEEGGGGGGTGGGGAGGGGIKLKLGGGRAGADGRQTREGSLAVGTPWGTNGGGVGGATPGAATPFAGTTPGPNLGPSTSSTSFPPNFDFSTSSSASVPPAGPGRGPEATPQPDFDYPDFLLSGTGLPALTSSLEQGGLNGFDWSGLGLGGGEGGVGVEPVANAGMDIDPNPGVTAVSGSGGGGAGMKPEP
ncbi:hypothetical protein JCM11251_007686 [Rhodosporidiobolus azoricus]